MKVKCYHCGREWEVEEYFNICRDCDTRTFLPIGEKEGVE